MLIGSLDTSPELGADFYGREAHSTVSILEDRYLIRSGEVGQQRGIEDELTHSARP